MAYSTAPKVRRDGVITLKDGTGTPVTLVVAYEEGNFSFEQTKADRTIIRDRGTIKSVRKGDDQPMSGSFTIYMRQFTSSSVGSVLDFINKTGAYSSNTSVGDSNAVSTDEYSIDIVFEVDGDAVGDSDGDTLATFSNCICTASFAEGDPNTITISFECFNGVTYS